MYRSLLAIQFLLLFLISGTAGWAQPTIICKPTEIGQAKLEAISANFFTVSGQLGGFDPCDPSVKFRIPDGAKKPPLIISVHGGGGIQDVLRSSDVFYREGFASLAFDAYSMQGIRGRDFKFWGFSVTNEARQRMIYATAFAAYKWAIQRDEIDTKRVYLFGISNGATVVANLAAVVNSDHVKGIIAEGITPIGIGLPDKVAVPILLAFGKLDNFGNPDPNGKRWELVGPCRLNILFPDAPQGTSRYCSGASNSGGQTPSPQSWAERIKSGGGIVEIVFFDDMAHSAFAGPLTIRVTTWNSGEKFGASIGATESARAEFLKSIKDFINHHK